MITTAVFVQHGGTKQHYFNALNLYVTIGNYYSIIVLTRMKNGAAGGQGEGEAVGQQA